MKSTGKDFSVIETIFYNEWSMKILMLITQMAGVDLGGGGGGGGGAPFRNTS